MKPREIDADVVRRVLLCLCAEEIRVASEEPRPITLGTLADHANSGLFCRALAKEANDNARVRAAEQRVAEHLRAPRRRP